MKVQLIVVQGKPEGKMIPLLGPSFKIGRGETCNLRPNSEQVSREHAEFSVTSEKVVVRDLGSRNGTLVNGKAISEPFTLKDRDLVQVGPLTFAVSIEGASVAAKKGPGPAPAPAPAKPVSPDDISHADIESWLVSDGSSAPPDRPSGIYGGDTQTISAYSGGSPPKAATRDEEEGPGDDESETNADAENETISDEETPQEEIVDESNPFYKPKKKPEAPVKASSKDSSDAAGDILRRLMERRRPPR